MKQKLGSVLMLGLMALNPAFGMAEEAAPKKPNEPSTRDVAITYTDLGALGGSLAAAMVASQHYSRQAEAVYQNASRLYPTRVLELDAIKNAALGPYHDRANELASHRDAAAKVSETELAGRKPNFLVETLPYGVQPPKAQKNLQPARYHAEQKLALAMEQEKSAEQFFFSYGDGGRKLSSQERETLSLYRIAYNAKSAELRSLMNVEKEKLLKKANTAFFKWAGFGALTQVPLAVYTAVNKAKVSDLEKKAQAPSKVEPGKPELTQSAANPGAK